MELAKEDKEEDGTARSSSERGATLAPPLSRAVLGLALLHWLTGEALVVRVGR